MPCIAKTNGREGCWHDLQPMHDCWAVLMSLVHSVKWLVSLFPRWRDLPSLSLVCHFCLVIGLCSYALLWPFLMGSSRAGKRSSRGRGKHQKQKQGRSGSKSSRLIKRGSAERGHVSFSEYVRSLAAEVVSEVSRISAPSSMFAVQTKEETDSDDVGDDDGEED